MAVAARGGRACGREARALPVNARRHPRQGGGGRRGVNRCAVLADLPERSAKTTAEASAELKVDYAAYIARRTRFH